MTIMNDMNDENVHIQSPPKTFQSAQAQAVTKLEPAPAPKPKPLILVVHASVGSGHRSAAHAIAQAIELLRDEKTQSAHSSDQAPKSNQISKSGQGTKSNQAPKSDQKSEQENRNGAHFEIPDDLEVEVLDILQFGRIVFNGDKTASLFTGATRPIYDLTWRYTLTGRLLWGGGTIWSRLNFPKFTEYVREKQPLAIVCTHITAANVAVGARMLTSLNFPIVCVPTDYETEGLWPHQTCDLFCVATEAMAETLRPRKVPDSKIQITGIPTRVNFRKTYDRTHTRQRFKLPRDKNLVLVLAGANLPRPYVRFRETVDAALPYFQKFKTMHFAVIAGQDQSYADQLRRKCKNLGLNNVSVFDYVENMVELMAVSDLAICKSGGLTVTEGLCARVPMILLGRAYGQEKINVTTLTAAGAAMHVTTCHELISTLEHFEANPQSTQAMLINSAILRRPEAALDIAEATFRCIAKAQAHELPTYRKRFLWFYWGKKPAHTR